MLHKTLTSYNENDPWDDSGEHPDGQLWLVTRDELSELPPGIKLETINGDSVVLNHNLGTGEGAAIEDREYSMYGLRGWR